MTEQKKLDIVHLIEKSPRTRLSDNYQSKLLKKIQNTHSASSYMFSNGSLSPVAVFQEQFLRVTLMSSGSKNNLWSLLIQILP